MNKSGLLIGVLATAGLAGVAVWVLDTSAGASASDDAATQAWEQPERRDPLRGGPAVTRVESNQRLDALEREVEALRREVKALRTASGLAPRIAAAREGGDADSPAFEGAVRDIIEDDRKEEREAETERRRERFGAMIDEAATELASAANLTDTEREGVAQLWHTEAEQVLPMIIEARSGDRSFTEVRDEVRKIREATDAEAKQLLSETQFESYEELRPRGGRRGR